MDRRNSIAFLAALGAVAASSFAQGPAKKIRIGALDSGSAIGRESLWANFDRELLRLGYASGDVHLERRWADGDAQRIDALARELVRQNVAVIAAAGTLAAEAAARATTDVPIVFMIVSGDPVKMGLVSSFGRPGGNITGNTSFSSDLTAKRIELFKAIRPRLGRVGVLWEKASAAARETVDEAIGTGRAMSIHVQDFPIVAAADLESAFASLKKARIEALIVAAGSLFFSQRRRLADLAIRNRVPTAFSVAEYVEAGGLFSYGPDLGHGFRQGAAYVDKILKGSSPAALPVERPNRIELIVNERTAKGLGIAIPEAVRLRADRLIG